MKQRQKMFKRYKCGECGYVWAKLHPRAGCPKCSEKKRKERMNVYMKKIKESKKIVGRTTSVKDLQNMLSKENKKPIIRAIETRLKNLKTGG